MKTCWYKKNKIKNMIERTKLVINSNKEKCIDPEWSKANKKNDKNVSQQFKNINTSKMLNNKEFIRVGGGGGRVKIQ